MVRGLPFTAGLMAVLTVLVLVHKTCSTENNTHQCAPSSCGNIQNISYPFRLKSDPEACGNRTYELSCENNQAVLYLFEGKYYVQEINYKSYTIRVVDSGIQKDNYFSTPSYSLSRYNFSLSDLNTYTTYEQRGTKMSGWDHELSRSLVLMSCEKPVNSPFYLDTSTCNYNDNSSSISDSKRRYRYVKVGRTNASEVEDSCQVEKMLPTSWPTNNDDPNISCTDVHHELAYGFELSWLYGVCESYCRSDPYATYSFSCYLNDANHVQCYHTSNYHGPGLRERILYQLEEWFYGYTQQTGYWWNAFVKNGGYTEYRLFWVYTVLYTGLAFGSSAIEEAHQSEEDDCAGIEVFSMVEAIHEPTGALIKY